MGAEGLTKKQARKKTAEYTKDNCFDRDVECVYWRVEECRRMSPVRIDCRGIYATRSEFGAGECRYWVHVIRELSGGLVGNALYDLRCRSVP